MSRIVLLPGLCALDVCCPSLGLCALDVCCPSLGLCALDVSCPILGLCAFDVNRTRCAALRHVGHYV